MPAFLSVSLRNDMHEARHFTVVDNIIGKTVLDDNLDDDETRVVKLAPGISGKGDISYTPNNGLTIRKFSLEDGDTVDMN